jgi:hypothetical protein
MADWIPSTLRNSKKENDVERELLRIAVILEVSQVV